MKSLLDECLEKLPDSFNMTDLHGKAEDKTLYVLVALQECERMNTLTNEIRRTLKELDLRTQGKQSLYCWTHVSLLLIIIILLL